ncbi:MAG: hypothetical protein O9301_12130 [Leptospira sp.]|nr:hypothetical protein [Leptospira sp.]
MFFKEGSAHFSFIEWDSSKTSGFAQKIEYSLLQYDPEFLKKTEEGIGGIRWETFKIAYRKKIGKFQTSQQPNTIEFKYNSLEFGEVSSNSPSLLLEALNNLKLQKKKIEEYDVFALDKNTGILREEGLISSDGKKFVWTHNPGNMNVFSPISHFEVSGQEKVSTEFDSSRYDYYQILYERNSTEYDRLFYKLIFSDGELMIYFVPPFANSLSIKTKEPLGTKRIGNFLIKEEIK